MKIDMRMNAYYYGFSPTGVEEIDEILRAVAWAGKAFHNTDQWQDKLGDYGPYENMSPEEYIQQCANYAATEWKNRK